MNTHSTLPHTATVYDRLAAYITRFAYAKGAHKGDAPADASRRYKSHFRVVRRSPTRVAVLFHRTDILVVDSTSPDTVMLHTDGYHANPTTREAYWDLGRGPLFALPRILLGTPPTRTPRPTTSLTSILGGAFYDGLTLDLVRADDGRPVRWEPQDPQPLTKYVSDREARRAVLEDPQVKAFFSALPVLFDGCVGGLQLRAHPTVEVLQDPENWPPVLRWAIHRTTAWHTPSTPEKARVWIRNTLTHGMTKEVEL